MLTDPFFQGRDWCGSCLGSLRWAFLQRAALIVHPVALELAQQVKEAFLVRRGPVDLLERQRNAAESERPKYCPVCDGSAWCGRGGVAVAVPCPVLCSEPAPGCARSLLGSLLLGPTVPSALEQPLSFPLFSPARGERGTHGEPQATRASSTATALAVKCCRVPSRASAPASLSTPLNLTFLGRCPSRCPLRFLPLCRSQHPASSNHRTANATKLQPFGSSPRLRSPNEHLAPDGDIFKSCCTRLSTQQPPRAAVLLPVPAGPCAG